VFDWLRHLRDQLVGLRAHGERDRPAPEVEAAEQRQRERFREWEGAMAEVRRVQRLAAGHTSRRRAR
jgi:hypothetical protein